MSTSNNAGTNSADNLSQENKEVNAKLKNLSRANKVALIATSLTAIAAAVVGVKMYRNKRPVQ